MERPEINVDSIQRLVNEYKSLSDFSAAADWDRRAQSEIDILATALDRIESFERYIAAQVTATQQERASKNALARVFGSRSAEKALEADAEWARVRRADIEKIADQLQEMMDYTPADEAERKSIIKELRLTKKELQVKKREITAKMQAVRVETRQQSAQLESFGIRGLAKVAAGQRRNIRRRREGQLAPSEDAKAAIERQLLAIDRRINWLERFGS